MIKPQIVKPHFMLVDTHCHLDAEAFRGDLEGMIAENTQRGVLWMLAQGTTLADSRLAVAAAEKFPAVYAAVGIHPNCILEEIRTTGMAQEKLIAEVEELASASPKVVAIGETGLDDYWKDVPMDVQSAFFQAHVELARRLKLPVVVHCRESEREILRIMEADCEKNGPIRGVIHSFSSNEAFLRKSLAMGFHISYSGSVTYTNHKYEALRRTAALVPADRLLLETDAPYLIPTQARKTAKTNQPWLAWYTAETLAEVRGTTPEAICTQTARNAGELFGVKGDGMSLDAVGKR